jgi:hypothetical protein
MALPVIIRLAAFTGFSACAFHGHVWSMRVVRISLFLAVISGMKHALSGAQPYAAMLYAGLIYPIWTYFSSTHVQDWLRGRCHGTECRPDETAVKRPVSWGLLKPLIHLHYLGEAWMNRFLFWVKG